jgi:copper homeostasis protein
VERAAEWGVPRVEFCADALAGGTTPDPADVRAVRAGYDGILGAMARPVAGSFAYDRGAWLQLQRDAVAVVEAGADFVVFGALDEVGNWDAVRLRQVVSELPVPSVLHRMFDDCADPLVALEDAIDAGFHRILTGWGARDLEVLKSLRERANGRIELLPGGGIRSANAQRYRAAGFDWIHSAALSPEAYRAAVPMPDEAEVKALML